MDQIVDYLSDYAAALSFNDLPAEVVHHAKRMLIDTLGCAIGGYASEPSKMARALAATVSSQQPATVLGSGQQTSLELATFANGVMLRYLDFNDGYTGQESGHPSDAIAAVLSPAEVAYHRGHFKNPMSDQEVEDKFRALAYGLLAPEQISRLLDRLWHLEQVQDIGPVIRLMHI